MPTKKRPTKKRLPSGSPDGKDDDSPQTESDDSYDNAVEEVEAEEQSKANWRVYQLRRNKNSPEKKMSKKARTTRTPNSELRG